MGTIQHLGGSISNNTASGSGGAIYDWGSHFVDQLWRLLWPAKPVRVFAQLRGNVWTTDAASSMVYKFSPEGKTLMQIEVGGQPVPDRGTGRFEPVSWDDALREAVGGEVVRSETPARIHRRRASKSDLRVRELPLSARKCRIRFTTTRRIAASSVGPTGQADSKAG